MKTRRRMKPWAQILVATVLLLIFGFVAFMIAAVVTGVGASTEEDSLADAMTAQTTSSEPYEPASEKLCAKLDGVYLTSREQAEALDRHVYGWYQSVKQENGVLAGWVEQLHDGESLSFLNEILSTDVAEECSNV